MESIGTPENLISIIDELSRLGNEITNVSDEESLFSCLSKIKKLGKIYDFFVESLRPNIDNNTDKETYYKLFEYQRCTPGARVSNITGITDIKTSYLKIKRDKLLFLCEIQKKLNTTDIEVIKSKIPYLDTIGITNIESICENTQEIIEKYIDDIHITLFGTLMFLEKNTNKILTLCGNKKSSELSGYA